MQEEQLLVALAYHVIKREYIIRREKNLSFKSESDKMPRMPIWGTKCNSVAYLGHVRSECDGTDLCHLAPNPGLRLLNNILFCYRWTNIGMFVQ